MKARRGSAQEEGGGAPAAAREPAQHADWRSLQLAATLHGCVGIGSVIGGTLRWLASAFVQDWLGPDLPWGTLFVNVIGSFVIGFYATLTGPEGRLSAGSRQRQFVMAGICGGFTTFSIFSLETVELMQGGHLVQATLNVTVSVVAWLAAVWLGHALATLLNAPESSRRKDQDHASSS